MMALRLMEVIVPIDLTKRVEEILKEIDGMSCPGISLMTI